MGRQTPDFVTQKCPFCNWLINNILYLCIPLFWGTQKVFLTMFVKRKKNRSGTTSVVVAEKTKGIYKELITIGVAKDSNEIDSLVNAGHEWISKEESRRHPQLDLYGEEREACDREREEVRRVLSNVSNILLNGCDLILDRTFDRIGFNRIDDEVRRLKPITLLNHFSYCFATEPLIFLCPKNGSKEIS